MTTTEPRMSVRTASSRPRQRGGKHAGPAPEEVPGRLFMETVPAQNLWNGWTPF